MKAERSDGGFDDHDVHPRILRPQGPGGKRESAPRTRSAGRGGPGRRKFQGAGAPEGRGAPAQFCQDLISSS
ncbi:hypothetical protein GCM10011534_01720 [Pseudooceanicola nanhaiensis]|uniref:Uncharacterized protein n=1 Tax=Pseudooceanicola nanhaiensis TaxID=375761 RepID=A0A917SK45_9RHOB|nr:hypothetical protein GCM10011534_01720 [Pseudooceanicola nanhaiensis]